jgi:outer membrane protein
MTPYPEKTLKGHPATPLFLAALFLVSLSASAQTKVGVLNVERIMLESPTAQRAQVRIREEFAVRDQELAKMAAQIKAMQTQLENNALTMSDSERQTREREVNEATLAFQRRQREFNEDVNKRREEELAGISDRLNRAVKQIAESEHFDIIFREVAWGSPRIDITDKVIKAIDESRPGAP